MTTITFPQFHDPAAPIQPLQIAGEFAALLDIYRQKKPRRVLEIGTYQGGTLYQWIRNAPPGAFLVAVDLPGAMYGSHGSWDSDTWGQWANSCGQSLVAIAGDSHDQEIVTAVRRFAPFDWLFIDGDHSYDGVRADFKTYAPMVSPGGVVVFHDILPHPPQPWVMVHRLWDELKASGRYQCREIIADRQQGMMGIGLVDIEQQSI